MKLKNAIENGNVDILRSYNWSNIVGNTDNRNWSTNLNFSNISDTTSITSNNLNNYNSRTERTTQSSVADEGVITNYGSSVQSGLVCNRQYRLDTENETNFENFSNKTESANLEGATESFLTSCESFLGNSNDSPLSTPNDEERAFEHSDSEESDKGSLPAPRGIVNPNYPGFQHLAHTLQNYSSDIENYYHSENDMTDDDIDIDITDATYDVETQTHNMNTDYSNINNNNNNDVTEIILNAENEYFSNKDSVCNQLQSDIPDLLKVTQNNNTDTFNFDYNCSATDIENNFNTKDIIGDFNKEIEDEIKQVLNYNINIQDDLEELKKDIEDNLTKPIENTINNISDVVNHVIKKLVKTQCDMNEGESKNADDLVSDSKNEVSESENEINALKELNQSRPSFLIIDNNINKSIADALLSDGKDEIKIYENDYDTDELSINVENTIKQLSTELRKIIPKLDELRDREMWFADKNESHSLITDGNCNEIDHSSKTSKSYSNKSDKTHKEGGISKSSKENSLPGSVTMKKVGYRRSNPRISRELHSDFTSSSSSHNAHYPSVQSKDECDLGSFDVYNIETALPKLDIDTIESHLKAAREAERRKHNDREEIRRRLAMGAESEDYYSLGHTDRPGKKPSLQSRLQSGKNLQICFMNETASDNESQLSDVERNLSHSNRNLSKSSIFSKSNYSLNNHPYQTRPLSVNINKYDKISTVQSGAKLRPSSLSVKSNKSRSAQSLGHIELKESDFFALQATLQTEARIALAQAKEMARIQMERERRGRAVSPVSEMLRRSMEKAHAPLAADRRRVSRHLLTDMNIAQLQVIVNELHSEIESLNESLVALLMRRDELHMGQDSMLVDIEDLTRYLGAKEQTKKTKGGNKSAVRRLASFVNK